MFDNNVADITASSTMSPINCTTVVYAFPEEDRVVVGYINEWINAYSFISSKYTQYPFFSSELSVSLPYRFLSVVFVFAALHYR